MHTLGRSATETVIWDKVEEAGIKWARIDVDWPTIQPDDPATFHWESVDLPVQAALSRDVSVYLSVIKTPAWASSCRPENGCSQDPKLFPPADYGDWEYFISQLVIHLQSTFNNSPKIKHFGIWNEPNLFDHFRCLRPGGMITTCPYKAYQGLLQGAYTQIHALCNDCKVVAPGTSDAENGHDYVQEALINDKNHIDIVDHHIYNDEIPGFWGEFKLLLAAIDAAGASSKPIWITETGWRTIRPGELEDDPVLLKWQAANLDQLLGDWLKFQQSIPTMKKLFIYDAINDERPPYYKGSFGILKSRLFNYDPKPSYDVFKHFLGTFPPADEIAEEGGLVPDPQ